MVFPPVLSAGQVVTKSPGDPQGGPVVPATTVKVVGFGVVGMPPVDVVLTARESARALQEIGMVSGVPNTLMVTVG
jgi:hypothetical protein